MDGISVIIVLATLFILSLLLAVFIVSFKHLFNDIGTISDTPTISLINPTSIKLNNKGRYQFNYMTENKAIAFATIRADATYIIADNNSKYACLYKRNGKWELRVPSEYINSL